MNVMDTVLCLVYLLSWKRPGAGLSVLGFCLAGWDVVYSIGMHGRPECEFQVLHLGPCTVSVKHYRIHIDVEKFTMLKKGISKENKKYSIRPNIFGKLIFCV